MRKDAKNRAAQQTQPEIARVQGYHSRTTGTSSNYAYNGFTENRYYTSDRFIKLDADFNRPDGKPLKGYGLEIELTSTLNNQTVLAEVLDKIIFARFPEYLFKMQNDGSLGGNSSAECITQVMTREFIRNHYPEFRLMFDHYFPALGIKADTSCGMHTNISLACFGASEKVQEECVRKLYYIVNHHFDAMCIMFRRDSRHTRYAGRMACGKAYCKTVDIRSQWSSHGVCFNLGHYNEGRIEIRLVGNQERYAQFRNTMETIFHLVEAVKKLSWDACDDLASIFRGCNQHVYDRLTMVRNAGLMTAEACERVHQSVVRVDFN